MWNISDQRQANVPENIIRSWDKESEGANVGTCKEITNHLFLRFRVVGGVTPRRDGIPLDLAQFERFCCGRMVSSGFVCGGTMVCRS